MEIYENLGLFDDTKDETGAVINPKAYGTRLEIFGEEYKAYSHDWYIFHALEVAQRIARREPEKVTKELIYTLQEWIRENYQHNHNLPYERIRSYNGYKNFVNRVIEAEYRYYDEPDKAERIAQLRIK